MDEREPQPEGASEFSWDNQNPSEETVEPASIFAEMVPDHEKREKLTLALGGIAAITVGAFRAEARARKGDYGPNGTEGGNIKDQLRDMIGDAAEIYGKSEEADQVINGEDYERGIATVEKEIAEATDPEKIEALQKKLNMLRSDQNNWRQRKQKIHNTVGSLGKLAGIFLR